jgi:retron-type reverse transcriptase
MLKSFAANVSMFVPCVSLILQSSIDSQIVPPDWKSAYICPVFKGGKRDAPNNYRPISLTSIVSKSIEHIISSAMWEHIDKNNLVTNRQHGFRKGLNTTTQLLHVAHNATKRLDQKTPHHLVSFDFAKAFDKVPHNLLIHKLTNYRFSTQVTNWIREWLRGRTSKVTVNGQLSQSINVSSGVPQGSVLGPLLFTLYINDIPSKIAHSDCRLYADDTLLCSDADEQNSIRLQNDITSLQVWSQQWCMPFNTSKCVHMQLGHSEPSFQLEVNGEQIPSSDSMKYLGLTFQSNINGQSILLT